MEAKEILRALAEVQHPAQEDRSLVDLGMVEDIEFSDGKVIVTLAFAKKQDPLKDYLAGAAKAAIIRRYPDAEVEVKTVVSEKPQKKQDIRELGLEQSQRRMGGQHFHREGRRQHRRRRVLRVLGRLHLRDQDLHGMQFQQSDQGNARAYADRRA